MAVFLALPSIQKANGERVLEANLTTIKTERKEKARNELLAYDGADLSETDDEINYTVSLKDDDGDQNIMMADLAEESASVTYNFKYIKALDLMVINSSDRETYYGFAYVNDDGEVDVQYDFNGASLTSINIDPKENIKNGTIPLTPKVYDLMNIGLIITDLDDVKGMVRRMIKIPTLLADGPLTYLLFKAKMGMIISQYIENASKGKVDGLISDQSLYSSWNFGLSLDQKTGELKNPGSLSDNGCGIIAMYNLLNDSNVTISLPTVIALTQMVNADLALGIFGVNPIDGDAKEILAKGLEMIFNTSLTEMMETYVEEVANEIFDNYLSELPDWLFTVMKWVFEEVAKATLRKVINTLYELIKWYSSLTFFIDQYLNSMHTFADIVDLFCDDKYEHVVCDEFAVFDTNIRKYSQAIIAFKNEDSIKDGAHTVYIKRIGLYIIEIYNFGSGEIKTFNLIESVSKQIQDRYIYGYVWHLKGVPV